VSEYFETRLAHHPGRTATWQAICARLQRYVRAGDTVVDVGAGRADFINNIEARDKVAIDLEPEAGRFCASGVRFIPGSATDLPLEPESVDVCFASNLLEHLTDEQVTLTLASMRKILRPGGRLVLIQPNYYYAYREYWDDYTHKKAFSHTSLADLVVASGFRLQEVVPRFLPFSFKSSVPTSYWLVRAYLASPWRPLAKQMLLVATKD
jgi:ubiquinone/menaquinone biosynthesis C-methylase UbiE